jgi:dihydroorotase
VVFKKVQLCGYETLQDVEITDGKITAISSSIKSNDSANIDGDGRWLIPGIIDLNVRLKNDSLSQNHVELLSNDASRGGVTTALIMPDFTPRLDNETLLELLNARLSSLGVNLYLAAPLTTESNQTLNNLATLIKNGAMAIQGDSSINANLVRRGLQYALMKNVPLLCNCYEPNLDDAGVMNEGDISFKLGLPGISKIAEISEVAKMTEVAYYYGAHLLMQSLSTMRSIELCMDAKERGAKITAEVSIHHLCKTDICCDDFNTAAKIKPPLREESTRVELLNALKDGKIDTLTSAHQPRSIVYKDVAFEDASFGIHAICDLLPLAYTYLVKPGHLSLERLMELFSQNPASVLGLKNKGKIAIGMDADMVLFDPKTEWKMEEKGSIYEGETFFGGIDATYVNGKCVYGG